MTLWARFSASAFPPFKGGMVRSHVNQRLNVGVMFCKVVNASF